MPRSFRAQTSLWHILRDANRQLDDDDLADRQNPLIWMAQGAIPGRYAFEHPAATAAANPRPSTRRRTDSDKIANADIGRTKKTKLDDFGD
ncbi:hypothetical protein MFIFM68171_08342 [Madurella fahalii]|uniref:Uncharacterized protein n=1 Tax=Madurella fahalii TaxID=1157608 RepID=A0ABQ0GK70_9PEZI